VAGPLGDIRVVEVSTGIAGGYAAKLFADAGADVVKVEPPGGDPLRSWTASEVELGGRDGALFQHLAASKRSVVGPADDLIAGADIVIEGGELDPLPSQPGLVVVSITPFGRLGPWVGRPATEFTVQAESGSLGARGTLDRPPVQAGGKIAEWVAGAYGAAAGLAAARHARSSGEGAHIDVSMAEAMCISTTLFTDLMMSLMGRPPLPPASRVVEFPSILPTKDGWVGFNTNAAQMFDDFLVLIGREEMVGKAMIRMDPTVRPGLEASAEAWTRQHTTDEVIEQASLFRIPVAPVGNGQNLLVHEHLVARGIYTTSPSGEFQRPRPGYRLNGDRLGATRPAPAIGEHTDHIEPRVRPATTAPALRLPMAGLKVLDLTSWWAGPAGTGLFAQLGADVIHVESIQRIDGMRPAAAGYFFSRDQWWEWSNFYLSINVDKRGITINLNDPRGVELVKRLMAWADVVAENFTPRVMDGFGLGWEAVHAINPRVVYARLPAYGIDGPWRDRVGFAQTMEAMSGLAWATGYADGPPLLPRGPCDPNGAMHAAFAMQVALAARDETGEGQLVEAPLIESALNIAAEQVVEYTAYGELLGRTGNRTPGAAPQGVYPCRGEERWLAVSIVSDEQWSGLRKALGDPPWTGQDALSSYAGRRAHADELDAALAAWAAGQELDEAVAHLVTHGVPAAPVNDFRAISSHPLFQARGFFETVDHPVVGTHPVSVLPFRWSGIDRWIRSPAPLVGEHNREVLEGILGLSEAEIAELEAAQVIGDHPLA
jgi:crotonobetainyl-CoA:carnitine CoA-transferase CaiB-like acyl-CoA transferase